MAMEEDKSMIAEFAIEALEDQKDAAYLSIHLLVWMTTLCDLYNPIIRWLN